MRNNIRHTTTRFFTPSFLLQINYCVDKLKYRPQADLRLEKKDFER